MIRFENSVDIERDADTVFRYLADLEHVPEWNWAIADSERLTPGPVRSGTRFRLRRTVPRPATEVLEITGLWPGRRIDVAGPLGPFAARMSYAIEATRTGTRLTNAVELGSAAPLGPLAGMVGGRIRAAVADNLGVLKRRLEDRR